MSEELKIRYGPISEDEWHHFMTRIDPHYARDAISNIGMKSDAIIFELREQIAILQAENAKLKERLELWRMYGNVVIIDPNILFEEEQCIKSAYEALKTAGEVE